MLKYCFCFMFWYFGQEMCGILTSRPGIEFVPPALVQAKPSSLVCQGSPKIFFWWWTCGLVPVWGYEWINKVIVKSSLSTISSSAAPFFSCPQAFPSSGSFPMSWLFASAGQSIGVSASVLPMNIQGWFPLGFTGLISLQSKGLLRVFSNISGVTIFCLHP